MAGRKRHTPEQIIRKLRQGDKLATTGTDVEEIARQLNVSVPTLYPVATTIAYETTCTRNGLWSKSRRGGCRDRSCGSRCVPGTG